MTDDEAAGPDPVSRLWRHLARRVLVARGSTGDFAAHSLWVALVDVADRPRVPVELEHAVHPPGHDGLAPLVGFLRDLVGEAVAGRSTTSLRVTALRTRPGGGGPSSADLGWAAAVRSAAARAGLGCTGVCFASRDEFAVLRVGDPGVSTASRAAAC